MSPSIGKEYVKKNRVAPPKWRGRNYFDVVGGVKHWILSKTDININLFIWSLNHNIRNNKWILDVENITEADCLKKNMSPKIKRAKHPQFCQFKGFNNKKYSFLDRLEEPIFDMIY